MRDDIAMAERIDFQVVRENLDELNALICKHDKQVLLNPRTGAPMPEMHDRIKDLRRMQFLLTFCAHLVENEMWVARGLRDGIEG